MYNTTINTSDIKRVTETTSEDLQKAGLPDPNEIYVGEPTRSWGAAMSEGSRIPKDARKARKPFYALRGRVYQTANNENLLWEKEEVLYPLWKNLLSDEQRRRWATANALHVAEEAFQSKIVPVLQHVKDAPKGTSWLEVVTDSLRTTVRAWQKSEAAGKLPRLQMTKEASAVVSEEWLQARIAAWEKDA